VKTVLMGLLGLSCLVLIASILFQSGNSAGLAGSSGGAEQLFGKKKSKGYEAILNKITVAGAVAFIICTLILVTLE